jgi:hypothetical protein
MLVVELLSYIESPTKNCGWLAGWLAGGGGGQEWSVVLELVKKKCRKREAPVEMLKKKGWEESQRGCS